jgi:hypothetical protein
MTVGHTTTGGAVDADGSYGGIGGSGFGITNATYGSSTDPTEFGSGGSGTAGGSAGSNGGGAVALRGGRFVIRRCDPRGWRPDRLGARLGRQLRHAAVLLAGHRSNVDHIRCARSRSHHR